MLVGNKSDLRHLRAVPTEEAKAFAGIPPFKPHSVLMFQPRTDCHLLKLQHWTHQMLNLHSKIFLLVLNIEVSF